MIPQHYHLTMVNPNNSSRMAPLPDMGTYLSLEKVTVDQADLEFVAPDFHWVISQPCSCEDGLEVIRDMIVAAERCGMELYLDGEPFDKSQFFPNDEESTAPDDQAIVEGVISSLLADPNWTY